MLAATPGRHILFRHFVLRSPTFINLYSRYLGDLMESMMIIRSPILHYAEVLGRAFSGTTISDTLNRPR